MYGIVRTDNGLYIVPMEYIKLGTDRIVATGIKDKTTAKIIIGKINSKIRLDK